MQDLAIQVTYYQSRSCCIDGKELKLLSQSGSVNCNDDSSIFTRRWGGGVELTSEPNYNKMFFTRQDIVCVRYLAPLCQALLWLNLIIVPLRSRIDFSLSSVHCTQKLSAVNGPFFNVLIYHWLFITTLFNGHITST